MAAGAARIGGRGNRSGIKTDGQASTGRALTMPNCMTPSGSPFVLLAAAADGIGEIDMASEQWVAEVRDAHALQ